MNTRDLIIIAAAIILIVVLFIGYKFLPRKLNQKKFENQWKKAQGFCKDKTTWPNALEEADKLLKRALKKRRFKGKSMGEKMVSAQRLFTDNDALWYAHNLYKKVLSDANKKLRESEVKKALVGYRQALRDLGALYRNETKD